MAIFYIVFDDIELKTLPSSASDFFDEFGVTSWDEARKKGIIDEILERIEEYEWEYTGNAIRNMSFELGRFDYYRDYYLVGADSGLLDVVEISEFYTVPKGKNKYIIVVSLSLQSDEFELSEKEIKEVFGKSLSQLLKTKPKLIQITFTFTTELDDKSLKMADKKGKVKLLR